jgi:hypothetical protein
VGVTVPGRPVFVAVGRETSDLVGGSVDVTKETSTVG